MKVIKILVFKYIFDMDKLIKSNTDIYAIIHQEDVYMSLSSIM